MPTLSQAHVNPVRSVPKGRSFTFGRYRADAAKRMLRFTYEVTLENGEKIPFVDRLFFPETTEAQWRRLPQPLLDSFMGSLSLMLGINYWKPHLSPELIIERSLTEAEANFWNQMYTKGLGEYFYRAQVDFRGIVSFPHGAHQTSPTPMPENAGTLLANGGGKDTAVSAELLKDAGIPFELFSWDWRSEQRTMAALIGKPMVTFSRQVDPKLEELWKETPWPTGFPLISTVTLLGAFTAALHGRRFVALSNEKSADEGNVQYLGMDVNHQWSKSIEAEMQMRSHIATSITPDIVPVSLLRPLSAIAVIKRFVAYPRYFHAFSSCNKAPLSVRYAPGRERGYWCGKCPKCAFVFAGLSAFLPRAEGIEIAGKDLFIDPSLTSLFRELLGIEGIKPLDCVGTFEEMIVAMHVASERGEYVDVPLMKLVDEAAALRGKSLVQMQEEVFSTDGSPLIPDEVSVQRHSVVS